MSAPIVVLLDATRVRAFVRDTNGPTVELPWDPASPDDVLSRLRDSFGTPSACVLVFGLGFLEIARPDLPPLSANGRRDVLLRDSDRYFPIDGNIAVAWTNDIAFAMASSTLDMLVRAFDSFAPVRAVTTIAHVCLRAGLDGTLRVDAGRDEYGQLVMADGVLSEARRVRAVVPPTVLARAVETREIARASLTLLNAPAVDLLLNAQLTERFAGMRRRRWLLSGTILFASLILLAWSAEGWRERELTGLRQRAAELRAAAAPALAAQQRLVRAATERAMLTAADSVVRTGAGPAAVLAHLAAVLPADAFVQRLEWDGAVWRIDGSANDAARIVPLLDADTHFQDVRFAAASTRFIDGNRQRESFSIAFRTRATKVALSPAGVHGAP